MLNTPDLMLDYCTVCIVEFTLFDPEVIFLQFVVYQMGRLCGGAHEISGIPAPLWLRVWVVERIMGWVVVMWVVIVNYAN